MPHDIIPGLRWPGEERQRFCFNLRSRSFTTESLNLFLATVLQLPSWAHGPVAVYEKVSRSRECVTLIGVTINRSGDIHVSDLFSVGQCERLFTINIFFVQSSKLIHFQTICFTYSHALGTCWFSPLTTVKHWIYKLLLLSHSPLLSMMNKMLQTIAIMKCQHRQRPL